MHKVRRILIPIRDLQLRSLPAIRKAAQLAQAWGAELELFHAIDGPISVEQLNRPGNSLGQFKAGSRHTVLAALERLAAPLRRDGLKVSTTAVWDYPAFEAIVRRARAINAGLIVTQSHGRHRLAGLLGYTDWELLRLSPMPVLLVKTAKLYRRPTVLAAVDPRHANTKSSALDRRILDHAAEFSRALRGALHAVHAYVPEPQLPPPGLTVTNIIPAWAFKVAEREARRVFEAALPRNAIRASHRHLMVGPPSTAIPATARKTHSAIVVLGAVSRSGLKRLFIGNTAEKVLDELPCDLLIVKPAKFATKIAQTRSGVQFVPLTMPYAV